MPLDSNASLTDAINKLNDLTGLNIKPDVVNAVTNKGVTTNINDTWATIVNNINSIKRGQGNAREGDVLLGKTFTGDDGVVRTGNMPNNYGNSIPAFNYNSTAGRLYVMPSFGCYNNGATSYIDDPNFKPENILSGQNIFGLMGNGINGIKASSGSGTIQISRMGGDKTPFTVSGLQFTPSTVILRITKPYKVNVGYAFMMICPLGESLSYNVKEADGWHNGGAPWSSNLTINYGGFTCSNIKSMVGDSYSDADFINNYDWIAIE